MLVLTTDMALFLGNATARIHTTRRRDGFTELLKQLVTTNNYDSLSYTLQRSL
jgi:hypothetical protein